MELVLRHTGLGLDNEARAWRVRPRLAVALFLVPFAGGALLGLVRIVDRELARFLLAEDSIVEWGTSLAILATAVLAALVARNLWREGLRAQAFAYALLVVLSVLAAGEEVSWGQRLLGLETPGSLRDANIQEELNIHNLHGVYPIYVAGMLLLGLYGSVGSWLVYARQEWRSRSPSWFLFMPPLFLGGAFLQLVLYRLVRYSGQTGHRYGEWCELCVAAAIAVFVALNVRRLRSERGTRGPAL